MARFQGTDPENDSPIAQPQTREVPAPAKSVVPSARSWPTRNWAGAVCDPGTYYLHLAAFPCERCGGPAILGWTGRREDDITAETEITSMRAICLSCGGRLDSNIAPASAMYFRPVEWRGGLPSPAKVEPTSTNGDWLAAELSQDADSG